MPSLGHLIVQGRFSNKKKFTLKACDRVQAVLPNKSLWIAPFVLSACFVLHLQPSSHEKMTTPTEKIPKNHRGNFLSKLLNFAMSVGFLANFRSVVESFSISLPETRIVECLCSCNCRTVISRLALAAGRPTERHQPLAAPVPASHDLAADTSTA